MPIAQVVYNRQEVQLTISIYSPFTVPTNSQYDHRHNHVYFDKERVCPWCFSQHRLLCCSTTSWYVWRSYSVKFKTHSFILQPKAFISPSFFVRQPRSSRTLPSYHTFQARMGRNRGRFVSSKETLPTRMTLNEDGRQLLKMEKSTSCCSPLVSFRLSLPTITLLIYELRRCPSHDPHARCRY